jgi:hypothetical protein
LVLVSTPVFTTTVTAQPAPPQAPAKAPAQKPAPKAEARKASNKSTLDLFQAVRLNDLNAIKSSIEAGADLFAENEDGMTAADLAVDQGYFIIAHYLLSRRMLGQTPPIALVPGKAKEAVQAAKEKPKRKFASPPTKPKSKPTPKPPMAPAAPPAEAEIASAPIPQEPMRIEVSPAPAEDKPGGPPVEAITETPATDIAGATDEVSESIAEIPASDIAEATDQVVETPAASGETDAQTPAEKSEIPLADEGFISFFKKLVDLITPGGEEPPKMAKEEAAPEIKPDVADAASSPVEAPLDESIVETVVDQSDEIIVEVTGDVKDGLVGESVEEVPGDTPLTLVESDIETVTAVPDKPEGEGKQEGSFLDRMASLFTSDEKTGAPKEPDQKGVAGEDPQTAAKADEVREYDLPMPPPKTLPAKKMSPRFLDNLADFLKTGDEEAFQAWLPETQILNPDVRYANQGEPPPAKAGSPELAAAPAPDKALKPPVQESPLADSQEPWSTADKPPSAPDPTAEETSKDSAQPDKQAVAEAPPEEPGMIKGVFNKLVDVLTPDFGDRKRPERLVLEPEEKLARADKKEGEDGKTVDGEPPPKYWPITEVETAEKLPVTPRKAPRRLKTSLSGVTLTLGQSVSLENSYPPVGSISTGGGIDPNNQCVKKNRGTTLFCLETVDWPEKMQPDFLVPTILYTRQKAIARYDQGIASRFHALFPSEAFKRIAQYLTERYGDPKDAWNRSIAPFAQPRQDNPILTWRSIEPKSQVITVVEIRKYDDSRGGFPDTNRGAVMLYLANSPPIFPQVSSHELMRISRTRLNQIPPPPPDQNPNASFGPDNQPPNKPADIDATLAEPAPTKSFKDMTAEEIQALRRKRKAKEAGGNAGAPAVPPDDSFELPSDPLNR